MQWPHLWTLLSIWIFQTLALTIPNSNPNTANPAIRNISPRQTTKNLLRNPSFESGTSPWQPYVMGSWTSYDVTTRSARGDRASYMATTSSSTPVTLTLFQSLNIPSGSLVDCSAWVRSERRGGATAFEVFLDGTSCGRANLGDSNWVRIGGMVRVLGDSHTFSVVAIAQDAGWGGWMEAFVDEARVAVI